jgi:hypothetical protein
MKILNQKFSHNKNKFSLTPMETILILPRELEYFEGLVKLTRKRKDIETSQAQVVAIIPTLAIRKVCINKTNNNKTLHLVVKINQVLLEGLIDSIGASMSIMAISVIRELGIMHLVSRYETYKTTLGMITHALERIIDIPITMGKMVCQMVFLVVYHNSYDLLLGLDFLMRIGDLVDVEKRVIHVRNGPKMVVEVLLLNMWSTC